MASDDLFYRYYDTVFAGKDYGHEIDAALALGLPGEVDPCRILELGSGTGNHTLELAKRGHSVTGVDIDSRMHGLATGKLDCADPEVRSRITFYNLPVADLPLREFDLALALFNVVNYIHELHDLLEFLREITSRLKPGASLIFDCWNGAAALLDPPGDKSSSFRQEGKAIRLELSAENDPQNMCTRMEYILRVQDTESGVEESARYELVHTLWPAPVIAGLASEAGLELRGLHPKSDPGREATIRDWKLLFHLIKP